MLILAKCCVGLTCLLHLFFLVLEMFWWTNPYGLKVFRQTLAQAEATATLAKNQGLYNGFLAAGLLWGLLHPDPGFGVQIDIFFLGCVVIAGIIGAITVNPRILFVQAMPAFWGLIFLTLGLYL